MRIALFLIVAGFALPALAQDSISKVNSGIHIEAGRTMGDLDTVNGGIHLGDNASAHDAETVNGGIHLGRGARLESAGTVNGGIELGENAIVTGDVETVNGGIELSRGAETGGKVANINGGISIHGARVGGRIETVNGDVTVTDGARVAGGLKVEKPSGWSWSKSRDPRIIVGPDSSIDGELVFERDVELYVHSTAKIGKVTGATAKRFDGELPTR
jgi:DUF4097 and DUF4098 domain-containing protein YvlB